MLLDKLCRMGMTFVDPLTLRDNPKHFSLQYQYGSRTAVVLLTTSLLTS